MVFKRLLDPLIFYTVKEQSLSTIGKSRELLKLHLTWIAKGKYVVGAKLKFSGFRLGRHATYSSDFSPSYYYQFPDMAGGKEILFK